jgi:TRAP-type C4-dicarboxylate transport system permease large subunit
MKRDPARASLFVLLVVHGFLALWGVGGFTECFWADPPWPRVSNELFPSGVLFLQWTLILMAAAVLLVGTRFRWTHTPTAIAGVYVAMAGLCAVQTVRHMESDHRFVAMGLEYVAYAGILVFVFRSSEFRGGQI